MWREYVVPSIGTQADSFRLIRSADRRSAVPQAAGLRRLGSRRYSRPAVSGLRYGNEKEPNPPPIILPAAGVALRVKPSYVLPIMFIIGLGTAAPLHRYTQAQCWDAVQTSAPFAGLNPRSRAILKKVLTGNNG